MKKITQEKLLFSNTGSKLNRILLQQNIPHSKNKNLPVTHNPAGSFSPAGFAKI
ncbi:MAG TPA: hypothetical protein VJY62_10780 [Bacteroidia bacterium]|nr:hypothetical protein [Bacteroidia bacterium]